MKYEKAQAVKFVLWLNSNIRCIEIWRNNYNNKGAALLNSNIRCIEIPVFRLNVLLQSWLNSNIRCIEIGKYMAWARQAEG